MLSRGLRGLTSLAILAAMLAGVPTGIGVTEASAQTANKSLRIPFPRYDGSMTPYTFDLGYPLLTLIYDTLLWRDPEGVPQPWLATATEDAEKKQVTLALPEGVKWHDEKPLTSADVLFTFDYFAKRPHPRFTPELSAIESVVATSPTSVTIRLRQASPGFLDQPLADLPILPAHLWRDLPEGKTPFGPAVGSGPYWMKKFDAKRGYVLEANKDYFRGPPNIKQIDIPIIADPSVTLQSFGIGRADMLPASLPKKVADDVESLTTKLRTGPAFFGVNLVLNVRQPPFNSAEVRQAISRALDLERISKEVQPSVAADNGILHPQSAWTSGVRLHEFQPSAARTVLMNANLKPLKIITPRNDPFMVEAARQVGLSLRRLGIAAQDQQLTRRRYERAIGQVGSQPTFQLAIVGTSPLASYDPDFLRRMFTAGPQGTLNFSGYSSPLFDELAQRVAVTADLAARKVAIGEMTALLAKDTPAIPLLFPAGNFAYNTISYNGWIYVKGSGIFDKQSFFGEVVRPRSRGVQELPEPSGSFPTVAILAATSGAILLGLIVWLVARRRRM